MKKISATRELQELLSTSEELIESLGDQSGAAVESLRGRLTRTVAGARQRLAAAADSAQTTAGDAVEHAQSFINERPWTAVLIGTSLGLLIGAMGMTAASSRRR